MFKIFKSWMRDRNLKKKVNALLKHPDTELHYTHDLCPSIRSKHGSFYTKGATVTLLAHTGKTFRAKIREKTSATFKDKAAYERGRITMLTTPVPLILRLRLQRKLREVIEASLLKEKTFRIEQKSLLKKREKETADFEAAVEAVMKGDK